MKSMNTKILAQQDKIVRLATPLSACAHAQLVEIFRDNFQPDQSDRITE